jgi:dTDP-4-amino-4,6-dideoxygalactose transaminase
MTCMSDRPIALAEPSLNGNEAEYLREAIASNFVSSVGPFVSRFEESFASSVGARHAVASSSGTAALHVALRVGGGGPGDEVFVPSFTFIASANAVSYLGATTTFVDSEDATWNLNPDLVLEELDRRVRIGAALPKAIEIVHILGHPANILGIVNRCRDLGIAVIEDAAESLGASYVEGSLDGRQVGTIGDAGCFSFNGNKVMTTGGGGMIVSDAPEFAQHAKHLTTQARLPGLAYDHDEVGYNYRLSNLAAAVGLAQLEQLPSFLEAKSRIAHRYDAAFAGLAGVRLLPRAAWARPSAWLYSLRIDGAERARSVLDALVEQGVGARPVWPPVHRMAPYHGASILGGGRTAERIAAETISLPSSVGLSEIDQDRVIDAVCSRVALVS